MTAFLDVCRFNPTAGGTTDFVVASAVTGYQTPAAAGAVNGKTYRYRAESADLTQWEVGLGTYTSGTTTLARTTVLFNSSGTTSKIGFGAAPQVAVVALAEDLLSMTETQTAGTFLAGPASGSAAAPAFRALAGPSRTVLTSGSGTYTTPAGALWLEVEMIGGGGGGGSTGLSGQTAGGTGGTTTFGTSLLTCTGGAGGGVNGNTTSPAGGTATGGNVNIAGASGNAPGGAGAVQGATGASSPFGGGGSMGNAASTAGGGAAPVNSGAGGGSCGGISGIGNPGASGAAGGYLKAAITSPLATYAYAVGAAGTAGAAGTSGGPGGAGGSGLIIVTAHFQ